MELLIEAVDVKETVGLMSAEVLEDDAVPDSKLVMDVLPDALNADTLAVAERLEFVLVLLEVTFVWGIAEVIIVVAVAVLEVVLVDKMAVELMKAEEVELAAAEVDEAVVVRDVSFTVASR